MTNLLRNRLRRGRGKKLPTTVNNKKQMKRLLEDEPIDGIVTDHPNAALASGGA